MSTQDQSATIDFLMQARLTTASSVEKPVCLQTHISTIVLCGEYAYKLKRAVHFPYLDFSNAEKRLAMCQRELALNQRTAPTLYVAVRRITRNAAGQLEFDGAGELVDAVVQMRRFEQENLFSQLITKNKLTPSLLTQLARHIAHFHQQATIETDPHGANRLQAVIQLNQQSEHIPAQILNSDAPIQLNQRLLQEVERHRSRLDQRARLGMVRRCHGDMHLNNICLLDGQATLFDCLEFNESMATTDIGYDLAFLLMDLWVHQSYELSNLVMNRYLDETQDLDVLPLLPLFMALRASIRAQVLATQAQHAEADTALRCIQEATRFIDLGFQFINSSNQAHLIAIGGLSGTGKSTLSAALAPKIGAAPGARILSSDRIRKQLAGVTAETTLDPRSYTPQSSEQVYQEQRKQAAQVLDLAYPIIADAVFAKEQERNAIEQIAQQRTASFTGFWLTAPTEKLVQRITARTNDPSDASPAVLAKQQQQDLGKIHWHIIQSDAPLPELVRHSLLNFTI